MSEQLDENVKRCQLEVEQRRERAEEALQRFFDALATSFQAWIPENVRSEVTRDHETTKRLGTEKVSELKADLAKLTADVPQLVRRWLNEKGLWAHRIDYVAARDSGTVSYRIYSPSAPAGPSFLRVPLFDNLRTFMIGFMAKHGFSLKMHGGHAYFPHYTWDNAALNDSLNRYADAYSEFQKAVGNYRDAVRAKGEHEAASIWQKS